MTWFDVFKMYQWDELVIDQEKQKLFMCRDYNRDILTLDFVNQKWEFDTVQECEGGQRLSRGFYNGDLPAEETFDCCVKVIKDNKMRL